MKTIFIYILSAISIILLIIVGIIIVDYSIKHPYPGSKRIEVNKPNSALTDIEGVLFIKGWSFPEPTHRWSNSVETLIVFDLLSNADSCSSLSIDFVPVHVMDDCQTISISLNQVELGDFKICNSDSLLQIPVKTENFFFEKSNILNINIPNAHKPDNPIDQRVLGFAISQFLISCK